MSSSYPFTCVLFLKLYDISWSERMEIVLKSFLRLEIIFGFRGSRFFLLSPRYLQNRLNNGEFRVFKASIINFHLYTFFHSMLREGRRDFASDDVSFFSSECTLFPLPKLLNTALFTSFFCYVLWKIYKNLWTHFSTEMSL